LGGEVKIESSLEPVEAQLAGREEPPGSLSCWLEVESWLHLLDRSTSRLLGPGLELEGSLGRSNKLLGLLVGGIKGVHKGVDTSTVSTVGDVGRVGEGSLGSKFGSILVETEVTVCLVKRVDEGVSIGSKGLIVIEVIVIVNLLLDRSCNLDRCSSLFGSSRSGGRSRCGSERSRSLTICTRGNMSSLKDSESILSSSVFHGNGFAILVNVTVLSNPLPISRGLLSVDCAIFLGKGRSKPSIPSIEPLLLEDLGILMVN